MLQQADLLVRPGGSGQATTHVGVAIAAQGDVLGGIRDWEKAGIHIRSVVKSREEKKEYIIAGKFAGSARIPALKLITKIQNL